jgi:hypothetical protein
MINREISRISDVIAELSNCYSEISERISKLSEEVSKNSKRIEVLTRVLMLLREDRQEAKGKVEKHKFFQAIREMKEKNILPLQNKYINFLDDIIKILLKKANSKFFSPFEDLVRDLWNKLSHTWAKKFSLVDCHNALEVLAMETDILRCHEKDQRKFYAFNPDSEFLKSIQKKILY